MGRSSVSPEFDPVGTPSIRLSGELDTLAVAPVHWRKGVGRALMSVAVDHLISDGYQIAILWTFANYDRGQAFYDACAWRPDGRTRDERRQVSYRRMLR
jgi:GNAT superfamily N-acetyltransferase